jgi:site-specific DNA-methyltransferase (adenine-specific)/modification methylase
MKPRKETLADGIELWLGDCREVLPMLGKVDAVVTDPPYGIGDRMSGGTWGAATKYEGMRAWDQVAPQDAVLGVVAICREAIVWGGNYFSLPPSRCWLSWSKMNAVPTMAALELAWTNLDRPAKEFRLPVGVHDTGHPTQKPLPLMAWCLGFLPDAHTILDPFIGSGTTGVACVQLGRKFIGIELDPGYFDIACRRISDELKRPRLDLGEPVAKPVQEAFI